MEDRRRVTFGGLWRSLYPVLLYMAIQVTASVLFVMVVSAVRVVSGSSPAELSDYLMDRFVESTITVVLLAAIVTIPIYGWLYYKDTQRKKWAGWKEEWFPLREWDLLWAMIGSAALALFCNGLVNLLPLRGWEDSYEEVSEALYSGSIWLRLAAVGFFGPAVEELTMRGLMYQRFRSMMRPPAAIFFSAVVFGLFHGNLVQGVYAFLIGIFFAWLMERTQRILVPMVGHMAANLLVVLLQDSNVLEKFYGSPESFWIMMLFCGVLSLFAVQMLKRERIV